MNTQTVARKSFEVRPFDDNFAVVRTTGRVGRVAVVITEDDAARIAQTLNAHDDLVAALRKAVVILEGATHPSCRKPDDAIAQFNALLSKVGP